MLCDYLIIRGNMMGNEVKWDIKKSLMTSDLNSYIKNKFTDFTNR